MRRLVLCGFLGGWVGGVLAHHGPAAEPLYDIGQIVELLQPLASQQLVALIADSVVGIIDAFEATQ